jgi:cation diffusion facilitator family transporter
MSALRRTALVSVFAAFALLTIKLAAGLASGSLGLVSEALHSGTDLVAALLTFFAVGYAVKPADSSHPYGHGKAEHLSALAEATVLALVSIAVGALAITRLGGWIESDVNAAWWAFAAAGVVIAIDLTRTFVSYRTARRHSSAALLSNALHFASDLCGTTAVVIGLVAVRSGWPEGDAVAALFVALLVVVAAGRLMSRNLAVLMDRAPAGAVDAAQSAIRDLDPPVVLKRLRLRQAGGRAFADVVIGVSPGAAVGQGHAAADRVEEAVQTALPDADVVVHVEPSEEEAELRERVHAAAMGVSRVREVHNLTLIETGDGIDVSLHLKLPGLLAVEEAHAIADRVEQVIADVAPEVTGVQTHIEPLAEPSAGEEVDRDAAAIEAIVRRLTGAPPNDLRFLHTAEGLVVYLTLEVDGGETLAAAHNRASAVEVAVRDAHPEIEEIIVHTEPREPTRPEVA